MRGVLGSVTSRIKTPSTRVDVDVTRQAGRTFHADDALRKGGVQDKNVTLSRRLGK